MVFLPVTRTLILSLKRTAGASSTNSAVYPVGDHGAGTIAEDDFPDPLLSSDPCEGSDGSEGAEDPPELLSELPPDDGGDSSDDPEEGDDCEHGDNGEDGNDTDEPSLFEFGFAGIRTGHQ